jgi:C1A family cysteine protease
MKRNTAIVAIVLILVLAATVNHYQLHRLAIVQYKIDQQDAEWTVGITSVSHITGDDIDNLFGAIIVPPPPDAVIVSRPTPLGVAAPADPPSFDWRNVDGVDWMTSVKHQGNCGSCWAHSAIGVVEAAFNIYTNNSDLDYNLSEQYFVSACNNAGTCAEGFPNGVLSSMTRYGGGAPNETCFPYRAADSACEPCSGWEENPYMIVSRAYINSGISNYKWALQTYGPISVDFRASSDLQLYKDGVWEPIYKQKYGHAVVLVGWNESLGAWICKNSWGTNWGIDGYFYVKYWVIEGTAYAVTEVIPHDDEPTPTPSGAQIDDDTDTITVDQSSYIPGDTVYMTASGTNIGDETWSGSVFFYSTSPSGYPKEEYTYSLTVVPGATRSVTGIMTLPSDAEAGIWTIQSQWIDDDGTVDARAIITI